MHLKIFLLSIYSYIKYNKVKREYVYACRIKQHFRTFKIK